MNAWRAPQRVHVRHRANQLADVRRHARSTHAVSALPCPEEPEAETVPGEDRLGSDDDESCPPSVPAFLDSETHSIRSAYVSGRRCGRERLMTWS